MKKAVINMEKRTISIYENGELTLKIKDVNELEQYQPETIEVIITKEVVNEQQI